MLEWQHMLPLIAALPHYNPYMNAAMFVVQTAHVVLVNKDLILKVVAPVHECERIREVSQEEKELLHDALKELKQSIDFNSQPISPFGSTHGFSDELIEDVIQNCEKIFSLDDIFKLVPVFSVEHAVRILEVFDEIFIDS